MAKTSFIRTALERLKDRAVRAEKKYPPLHHMLVLPPGETLRFPLLGVRALGMDRPATAVAFAGTKVGTRLPPRSCWPTGLLPALPIAIGGNGPKSGVPKTEPYRVHLFFGDAKGLRTLKSLASEVVALRSARSRGLGRSIGSNHVRLAQICIPNDVLCTDAAAALDAWLCTIHWWAWKVVDSPIHGCPKVLLGTDAIEAEFVEPAVRDQLSFSYFPLNVFAMTAAMIDLLVRFQEVPPIGGWDSTYPQPAASTRTATDGSGSQHPSTKIKARVGGAGDSASSKTPRYLWRKEGEVWVINFEDERGTFWTSKGLGLIAKLLKSPNPVRPFTTLDLMERDVRSVGGGMAPQPTFDRTAEINFEKRRRDLRRELDQAETHNDEATTERVRGELEDLESEVKAAAGLGNTSRPLGPLNPAKKAQVAAGQAIHRAYKTMRDSMPELVKHLKASITTGRECAYRPSTQYDWEFE